MKRLIGITLFVIILIVLTTVSGNIINEERHPVRIKRRGTAVVITGAAARIPQEAALLEQLFNKGMLHDVIFISGVSSGSLNTVVLNAILNQRFTWDRYKRILFSLRNKDVFIQKEKSLPVDTRPLHNLLTSIACDSLGYKKLGDLPIACAISIANFEMPLFTERTYRLSNLKINSESDPDLDLVDVLMASTSFPVAFPPVKIANARTIPDVSYIDGGIAEDHVPFEALLEYEKYRKIEVERLFIVSRKNDEKPEISEELKILGVNDFGLFDHLGISLDDLTKEGFIKRLKALKEEAPSLASRTFVYVPGFKENFLVFDFNDLKEQYDVTSLWARNNEPVLLDDYLSDK